MESFDMLHLTYGQSCKTYMEFYVDNPPPPLINSFVL